MNTSQWHMNKLGLIDFWYYTNEEFPFQDGHMLLRGSNGSGKSVTMQSFIPLLLDGNKSSERLDSFGTRSRKLENYLLEEDGDRDDRIGYLYLEFKRKDSDIYKTIGIGLHARRYKPLDSWHFVIEDNRRINKDIFLMENDLAITKQMLKNRIQDQLIDSPKEYMAKVNQALFGFSNIDEYKEVINLLLQLRSPKLSNSLKPTSINEILSNSLQPLSEDDLRPMSEAITNMDDIKDQLDTLKQSFSAAKIISSVYEQYNVTVLSEKIERYLEEDKKLKEKLFEIKSNQEKIDFIQEENIHYVEKAKQLQEREKLLENEKRTLLNNDMIQLVDELNRYKQELDKQKSDLHKKQNQEERKEENCIDYKKRVDQYTEDVDKNFINLNRLFKELTLIQEELQFSEHDIIKNEVMEHPDIEFDPTFTNRLLKEEMSQLKNGILLYQELKTFYNRKDNYLDEKEQFDEQLEIIERDLKNYQQLYIDTLEEYKEKFYQINRDHSFMKVNDEEMSSIINVLQQFEVDDNYFKIDHILHTAYHKIYNSFLNDVSHYKNEINRINEEHDDLQNQYQFWEQSQNLMPEITSETQKNRVFLDEQQVPYRPLYTLLEFGDHVSEEQCNLWEETLDKAGLLNAIVIQDTYRDTVLTRREGMSDHYLFTTKPVESLESCFLVDRNQQFDFNQMMKDLFIDKNSIILATDWIETSLLTVTLSHNQKNNYIGQVARERLRAQKLDELQNQLDNLLSKNEELEEKLTQCQSNMEKFEKEYHEYPLKDDLFVAKQSIYDKENELNNVIKHISSIESEIKRIDSQIVMQNKKIVEIADKLKITMSEDLFQSRYSAFEEYNHYFTEFVVAQNKYAMKFEQLGTMKIQCEESFAELDTIRIERMDFESSVHHFENLIKQSERQLVEKGYQDIEKRISEVSDELRTIPIEREVVQKKIGHLESQLEQNKEESIKFENQKLIQEETVQQYFTYYKDEAMLGYCLPEDIDYKQTKLVLNFLNQKKTSGKRKEVLMNELQTAVLNQRGALQDYSLVTVPLFQDEKEDFVFRLAIFARYKGNKIHFDKLLSGLEKDIERQSILLEDSDRSLIEDILVNDMSRKIRRLISSSEQWVDDMNRFMDTMNTSSGLTLNLEWKSRKAENDEELSSQKLVKLLKTDVGLLKENDLKLLSSHFRSKIATARRLSEKEEVSESFHQVMRRVMDYRNWFDFTILYEKTGEKKRELTNNAFFAFSGGEKAMSMYVPLFSAVAAKYTGANDDAPLMIALDEAFAGVDEKNIDNMFSLIGKFGFDYIMNSQVLWGDYPSVKSLAIHELFRPENARFVTVISYTWNGYRKELVNI